MTLPSHWHTHSSQAWTDQFYSLCLIWGIQMWKIWDCCQVCIKISRAPVVLMAGLWVVTMAMVECGQAGDVPGWLYPRVIERLCACIQWLKSLLPLLLSSSWEVGSGVNGVPKPGSVCSIHTGGFGVESFGNLKLLWGPVPNFLSIWLILTRAVWQLDLIKCDWCCVGRTQVSQTVWSRSHRVACWTTLWLKGCEFSSNKRQNPHFAAESDS